jgi:dephospho-CoA kinase
MLRVGLTGPAGSGKTIIAAMLAKAGCAVVDADRAAHDLYVPGSALVRDLARAFGDDILCGDGSVDRGALGRIVFASPSARTTLNALVHPPLVVELRRRLDALETAGASIAILDAALLLQWRADRLVTFVVGVWAPGDLRLARLVASGISRDVAAGRVDAQMSEATLRSGSDVVIENTGSLDELRVAVEHLFEELKRRSASQ